MVADRAAGQLSVEWADGHRSGYGFEYLRWNCPCAECAGEAGLPGRLATLDRLRPEQFTLVSMEPVGLFGIRPSWQDGHDSGIYGLRLLRSLCPCQTCAADTTAQPARVRRPGVRPG
jgi:DUF971 family protein